MATPMPVEAMTSGEHACLTFSDAEERLDIVAAFVRDGIERGQRIVCLTDGVSPDDLSAQLADRHVDAAEPLRRGQLRVEPIELAWGPDGCFTAESLLRSVTGHLRTAREAGYHGLRVTADMSWATRPLPGVEQLVVFESAVNELFGDGQLTAICQYDRQRFDAVTLAVVADAHPHAVAAATYHDDPVLRICRQYSRRGIRVAGEIDYRSVDALGAALGETLRLDHHLEANLLQLRFLDAAAAAVILNAARALPGDRRMTVRCGGLVARVLTALGATDVPHLRLVVTNVDA